MKTTIDAPEADLAEAMKFTGAKTKRDAVVRAMPESNRRQRLASLIQSSETFDDEFFADAAIREVDALRDRRVRNEDH